MRISKLQEGWHELPPIDREKYQERDGLEGPIQTKSGKVVYYDPKAGSYYDPDTDMYISYDDWRMLDSETMHKIDRQDSDKDMDESDLRLPASTAGLRTGVSMRSGAKASGPVSRATYDQEMSALSRSQTAVKPIKKIAMPGRTVESENPAMDKALRSIEKTFGPERKAINDKILTLLQAVQMLSKPQWAERAIDHASQYGINSKQELAQELQLLLKNEMEVDDDEIHGVDSNIKSIEKALDALGNSDMQNEQISEGTWAIPNTAELVAKLENAMSKPIPAKDASDMMYSLIGDDELFDSLGELEDDNPESDARPTIQRWLSANDELLSSNIDDESVMSALRKMSGKANAPESDNTKYGIVRYPDTAISYIKNDGNGWEHIYDKSYGFDGPVDKDDLQYASKIAKEKIPGRMLEACSGGRKKRKMSEVAGPDSCWSGYAPGAQTGVKTKPGTGKNKGKRVNNCEPVTKKKK